jgi:predicted glycosyltransferase
MLLEKNNITVLVAPLDWGLGHATRCIPIIRVLVKNGCTVLIATSGPHRALLQVEFPDLRFLELPGYGITYSKMNVLLRLALQLPRFFNNIKNENRWLQQAIHIHHIDAVISDNRYGLYSKRATCVFITHQLHVQAPPLFKWTEKSVRNRLYSFIEKFDECWIPDLQESNTGLGGALSYPAILPKVPITYIGWLTRFLPQAVQVKKYRLLISLSGPEPQRTLLEQLLSPQLKHIAGNVLVIRGLPGENSESNFTSTSTESGSVTILNHLPATALQKMIAESEFFLSRCGYSTLMDLQAVACRCIFVPTPGQTEQEYLGRQISALGKALVLNQKSIDLPDALNKAASLPYFSDGSYQNTNLEKILIDWLKTIGKS